MSFSSIAEQARHTPKLSEVLFDEPSRNFSTIAALPSNVQAIENALLFATGSKHFLALVGPSGWGKSHILEAVACRIGHDTGVPPRIFSAIEWIYLGARADAPGALLLDNVQDALDGARTRLLLQIALERRVRGGRPTLLSFTASRATRQIKSVLPNARAWMIGAVPTADPVERTLVIDQMASAEGLHLAPSLVRLMATRMKGNGRTLSGALKRLRLSNNTWADDSQVLRACGILDPFFSDNSAWDLSERILRTSEDLDFKREVAEPSDLALHTMLRVAGLSESAVARCFGVQPAEAYSIAERFELLASKCETTRHMSRQFVGRIVATLSKD